MSRSLPSPGDGVADAIAEAVNGRSAIRPVVAVVLGSGLGEAITVARGRSDSEQDVEIAYEDLPGFPRPSVLGHAGRLWLGTIGGVPLAAFQGRVHYYEGHPMPIASLTARVASALGARSIVLTTAVGGLDPTLVPGTMVVIRDHINLMGENPLASWRMPDGSPAFVDLSGVYDRELGDAAMEAMHADGSGPVAEGVYLALSGPSYETPAETEYLRRAGGTVVGMSMVPEAVAGHALGLRVLGLSFVTNTAGSPISHGEVLAASDRAAGAIGRLLVALIDRF